MAELPEIKLYMPVVDEETIQKFSENYKYANIYLNAWWSVGTPRTYILTYFASIPPINYIECIDVPLTLEEICIYDMQHIKSLIGNLIRKACNCQTTTLKNEINHHYKVKMDSNPEYEIINFPFKFMSSVNFIVEELKINKDKDALNERILYTEELLKKEIYKNFNKFATNTLNIKIQKFNDIYITKLEDGEEKCWLDIQQVNIPSKEKYLKTYYKTLLSALATNCITPLEYLRGMFIAVSDLKKIDAVGRGDFFMVRVFSGQKRLTDFIKYLHENSNLFLYSLYDIFYLNGLINSGVKLPLG